MQLKISKNSNLYMKIGIFTIFSCSCHHGLLSSQPDGFRVNEIIFAMIKTLMALGDQTDWWTLKDLYL